MRSKVSAARRELAALRRALLSPGPEQIEESLPRLAEAVSGLSSPESEPDIDRKELEQLQAELTLAAKLIEHGAAFYKGWAKLLASAACGYTPSGDAPPLDAAGTVSVRG